MSWCLAAGGVEAFALLQENQGLWKSFMPSPYDFEGSSSRRSGSWQERLDQIRQPGSDYEGADQTRPAIAL